VSCFGCWSGSTCNRTGATAGCRDRQRREHGGWRVAAHCPSIGCSSAFAAVGSESPRSDRGRTCSGLTSSRLHHRCWVSLRGEGWPAEQKARHEQRPEPWNTSRRNTGPVARASVDSATRPSIAWDSSCRNLLRFMTGSRNAWKSGIATDISSYVRPRQYLFIVLAASTLVWFS